MPGRSYRITHVVKAVEDRDQIKSAVSGIAFRTRYFERDLVL